MKLQVGESKTVEIYSKIFWNETDLEILAGEEYKFDSVGSWKDLLVRCNSDGYVSWYMNLYNNWKRSPGNNWFALIGSLDKRNDFLIGKQSQLSFHNSGKLYCYANDVRGFYWNNSGQISLTISRIK